MTPASGPSTPAGPVFIAGPDRCGKTLMAAILGSHPAIAISPVGSNMWTLFYRRFGDLASDANLERCLAALLRYRHVRLLEPDPERIRREFRAGDATYARLFALFQAHYADRLGKPRWGDQTGLIERYADEIFAAYPGATMVHMIRDPRDRYEASLALWPGGRLRAGGATARWLYSVRLGERNLRRHPGRYRLVRYEDLVTGPEPVAREVCAFVGETFDPRMLEVADFPLFRAKLEAGRGAVGPDEQRGLISAGFVGRFRGRVPLREIAFIERRAGKTMRAYGYPPDGAPLAGTDRLRYALLDLPSNWATMEAWRAREQLAYRLPRWLGRSPVASKVVHEAAAATPGQP